MTGLSNKVVKAATDAGVSRSDAFTALDAAYPIIRAELAKDPDFLTMVCGRAVDDLRAEIVAEIAEAVRDRGPHTYPAQSNYSLMQSYGDFIEREFGGET